MYMKNAKYIILVLLSLTFGISAQSQPSNSSDMIIVSDLQIGNVFAKLSSNDGNEIFEITVKDELWMQEQ